MRVDVDRGAVLQLAGDGGEDPRCEEVSGRVVERLGRQRAGGAAVGRLGERDAGGGLDDAVEAAMVAPGSDAAPRVERGDDQPRSTLRQVLRRQAEPVERPGPVAGDDDVGRREQGVERLPLRAEVQQRRSLAHAGVEVLLRDLREAGRVESEHVRAEVGEGPRGHRAGDDPGQVEHPQAGGRSQRSRRWRAQSSGRRFPDRLPRDQRESFHRGALRVPHPLLVRADGDADASRGRDRLLGLDRATLGEGGREIGCAGGVAQVQGREQPGGGGGSWRACGPSRRRSARSPTAPRIPRSGGRRSGAGGRCGTPRSRAARRPGPAAADRHGPGTGGRRGVAAEATASTASSLAARRDGSTSRSWATCTDGSGWPVSRVYSWSRRFTAPNVRRRRGHRVRARQGASWTA